MGSSPYMLLTTDDVITLLFLIVFLACLAAIVSRVLVFVPSLLSSVLRSVVNPSLIYSDDYVDNSSVASSDFGSKTLADRVSRNEYINGRHD